MKFEAAAQTARETMFFSDMFDDASMTAILFIVDALEASTADATAAEVAAAAFAAFSAENEVSEEAAANVAIVIAAI